MAGRDGDGYMELRVHGVAGTPPESMLGLAPVPAKPPVDPEGRVVVYCPPEIAEGTRAFSWSALTSGTAVSALWLLLLPYMLANVAGWAVMPLQAYRPPDEPPEDPPPSTRPQAMRWITLIVRLGGLIVTAIFVLFALLTFVDIAGYQGILKGKHFDTELARFAPAAGVAATAIVVGFLFAATHMRLREEAPDPWANADDPAGLAWLDRSQARMWNSPGIIARLRRLHLAAGLALTALVSMASLRGMDGPSQPVDDIILYVAAAGLAYALVFVAILSLSDGGPPKWATGAIRGAWVAPLVAVTGAVCRFACYDWTNESAVHLPAIRGSGGPVALLLFSLVVWGYVVAWRARDSVRAPGLSSFNMPALLLTGATVGTIFGSGLAAQVARLFGGDRDCTAQVREDCKPVVGAVIDWVSVGFTWMLTLLLLILLVWFAASWVRAERSSARLMRAVRAMADNVSRILALLTGIGMTALAVGLGIGFTTGFPEVTVPRWIAIWSQALLLVPLGAAGAIAAFRFVSGYARPPGRPKDASTRWWVWGLAAAVLGGFVWWITARDEPLVVAGITLPPATYQSFARTVAITLPTTLVLVRLVSGFRDRNARRGVAIAWDLGNFWPRWYHPFAPPTYSDVAVTRLTAMVDTELEAGRAVLLAPHSQGSIIAAASVIAVNGPTDRLALLTYGSPLSRLYARAFPAVFTREALGAICDRLGSPEGKLRWKNLFRLSDPIGGKVVADPPVIPENWREDDLSDVDCEVPVREERNHSDYSKEPEYKEEARKLREAITSDVPR